MKIAVECKSPLLQKSLEVFLAKYLSSAKHCDIIVNDKKLSEDKKYFYIAADEKADLQKPFSKSQLILSLEQRYREMNPNRFSLKQTPSDDEPLDFAILEDRIEYLTQEYKQNIIRAIKAFYEA